MTDDHGQAQGDVATLLNQAGCHDSSLPATDDGRPMRLARLTTQQRTRVVKLFQSDHPLSAIARQVGISWDSVARILDDAGLRPMPGRRW